MSRPPSSAGSIAETPSIEVDEVARPSPPRRSWQAVPGPLVGVLLALPLLIFLAVFVVYPVLKVIADSFIRGGGVSGYAAFLRDPVEMGVLWTTLRASATVTLLSLIVGGCLAWFMRTIRSGALKVLVWTAVFSPLWMGVVVKNYAFTLLLGRRGAVNRLLESIGVIQEPLELLYTEFAVVIGMTYSMLPFAIIPLYVAYRSIDPDMIKAAESLGASRSRAFVDVVLRLTAPSFVASAAIVYVMSIGFYITPVILGGTGSPFIATFIEQDIFRYYNYGAATVKAAALLVVAFLTLGLAVASVGQERIEGAIR